MTFPLLPKMVNIASFFIFSPTFFLLPIFLLNGKGKEWSFWWERSSHLPPLFFHFSLFSSPFSFSLFPHIYIFDLQLGKTKWGRREGDWMSLLGKKWVREISPIFLLKWKKEKEKRDVVPVCGSIECAASLVFVGF